MAIRFKCPHCQKPLSVKDELAGKKAACPVCKSPLTIPAGTAVKSAAPGTAKPGKPAPVAAPADLEALAAAALADEAPAAAAAAAAAQVDGKAAKTIDFECSYCGEELHLPLDQGGKQAPCPECRRIIKVPLPKEEKPKDWRELAKKGPAAALVNQPDQLEGAWGTETKTKVSGTAMQEAGATPETKAKPVGMGGWIKRLFYLGLVVGAVALAWRGIRRGAGVVEEKNNIARALEILKKDAEHKEPKFSALVVAETHRGVGLVYIRKGEAKKAREHFREALAKFQSKGRSAPEQYVFLVELALARLEMGGDGDPVMRGQRYPWLPDSKNPLINLRGAVNVLADLKQTLENLESDEAKAFALREVTNKLLEAGQPEVALSLAGQVAGPTKSPMMAVQVGLLVGRDKMKEAKDLIEAPDSGKGERWSRLAYTEGHSRKKDFTKALDLATAAGPPAQRLEACLGAADIALADGKKAEAKPFLDEALNIANKEKSKLSPLLVLYTLRVAAKAESAEALKPLIDYLPADARGWGKLALVEAQVRQAGGLLDERTLTAEFSDKEGGPRALAHGIIARHNARVGQGSEVRHDIRESGDDSIQAMLYTGLAVGEQERQR